MIRAIDAANFFINIFTCYEEDNDLSNMKINKLLYYSQGHSFERFGKPLFHATIEAWDNGPVINNVYQNIKSYGSSAVTKTIGNYDPSVFTDDESELLLDVAREYGKYSAGELRNMTHAEGSPWCKNYIPGAYHAVIPDSDISEYFISGNKLSRFELDSNIETIGYSEDGCLVLSREEFDDWDY